VKRVLALYFIVLFGAILLRVDYFPLSWVPMYGAREPAPNVIVKIGDKAEREAGFVAVRANGETVLVGPDDLNIPNANYRRLYNQRAFNNGPPQDDRERLGLAPINRWWYETFVGPDPRLNKNYVGELLHSVNATFGYGPADPRRIVRLEASLRFADFQRSHLDRGDLSQPEIDRRTAIITETGAFIRKGGKLEPMPRGIDSKFGEIE
jgi:hypothetical protein